MIGINAQLNPQFSGGCETNLLSLLRALRDAGQSELTLLTFRKFVRDFEDRAPASARVVDWRFGQNDLPPARGQRLRRFVGPDSFDRMLDLYRRARYRGRSVGRPSIDKELRSFGIKALHFPYAHLFDTSLPFIYEPWDLQHLHFPQFFSPEEVRYRERIYRHGCEKATIIITATKWTKNDIVKQYGVDPERIVVLRRSSLIARHRMSDELAAHGLAWEGIPADFIFYPAMTFEHKNHIRLLQALKILKDRGTTAHLVLSGRFHQPNATKVRQAISELDLEDSVTNLGEVNDKMLTALYHCARLVIYPSMFEGLGLPILEAFSHGTPVVAARASCIPEVAGDAAILFNEQDANEMANAISLALNSPQLLRTLRDRGLQRLAEFEWSKNLPVLLACYNQTLGKQLSEEENFLLLAAKS